MSVGNRFIYQLAKAKLGRNATEWLDTPHLQLVPPFNHRADHSDNPDTPRSLAESGCPACIFRVSEILEAL